MSVHGLTRALRALLIGGDGDEESGYDSEESGVTVVYDEDLFEEDNPFEGMPLLEGIKLYQKGGPFSNLRLSARNQTGDPKNLRLFDGMIHDPVDKDSVMLWQNNYEGLPVYRINLEGTNPSSFREDYLYAMGNGLCPNIFYQDTDETFTKKGYEVMKTPDMGMGAFATENLESGTEVLVEKARGWFPDQPMKRIFFTALVLSDPTLNDLGYDAQNAWFKVPYFRMNNKFPSKDEMNIALFKFLSNKFSVEITPGGQEFCEVLFARASRFNHSAKANCKWKIHLTIGREKQVVDATMFIKTIRDIKEGTQLTIDYNFGESDLPFKVVPIP